MEARYRYRLRVTPSQAVQLQAVFDSCRFVWNTALGRWSDLWRYEGINYSTTDMCRELTDWRCRFDWLAEQPCTPQQQVLRDLDRAVSAFYNKANPAGRPRFKRKKATSSARWTATVFDLADGRLRVTVAGGRIGLRVVSLTNDHCHFLLMFQKHVNDRHDDHKQRRKNKRDDFVVH